MKRVIIVPFIALALISCGETKRPEDMKAQRTADAKVFLDKIVSTVSECDSYDNKMADASQKRDVLEIYQVAKSGEAACDQAYRDIREISVPKSLSKKNEDAMREHLSDLALTYSVKGSKFSLFGKVANGDTRPSTLTDLQQTSEDLPKRLMMNMAQIYTTFADDGVDLSNFGEGSQQVSGQQSQTTD